MKTNNNETNEIEETRPQGRGGRANRKGMAGGRPQRGRGATRGRSRKRPLAHGDLRLLILNIIKATPSHGYGLISEIKTLTSGFYEPSPGVIYPALETLQDLGWVDIQPEKGKRVLHITESGQAELLEQREAIKVIEKRLKKLSSAEQEVEPDDIRGALRQLRHATASIFKGKNTDVETRKAAVAIVEDARKKILALG